MWMVPPFLAFVITLFGTPFVGFLGRKLGLLDMPNELSIHKQPVPRTGGVAMLVAFGVAVAVAWFTGLVDKAEFHLLLGLLAGTVIVGIVGLLDDTHHISLLQRLLGQLVGAVAAIALGVRIETFPIAGVMFGLSLFFLVAVPNVVPLMDGFSWLATSIMTVIPLGLAGWGFIEGQPSVSVPVLAIGAAWLGYLPYSIPRARILLGNLGSLSLGFILAGSTCFLTQTPYAWSGLLAPFLMLALSVALVLVARSGALGSAGCVSVRRFQQGIARLFRCYVPSFTLDAVAVVSSFLSALVLRFSPDIPRDAAELPRYLSNLTEYLPYLALVYLLFNGLFGLYGRVWRYASAQEALFIASAGAVGTVSIFIADTLLPNGGRPLPLSVVVMGGILSTLGFAVSRYRFRLLTGILWRVGFNVDDQVFRTLIVGAGEAGQLLAWRMRHQATAYLPVGFVDDDPGKLDMRIHGIRVLGNRRQIPNLVERLGVELVVVAIHKLEQKVLNEIVDLCLSSEAKVRLLPDVLDDMLDDQQGLGELREVQIEDLLGRPTASIDQETCRLVLQGKVVLVTGAAGSIGAELCRQILPYHPGQLLALDHNETGLYNLALELGAGVEIVVADIRDGYRIEALFRQHRPQIVYHAAAYKHVPILEQHPEEAFATNVVGTQVLAEAAARHGIEHFISISTDKAVCPCSVLGVTKRLGELVVRVAAQNSARSQSGRPIEAENGRSGPVFASVRFGNVLGSQGSVVPTFDWQIEHGGPVTVTDPRMTRFFMSVGEAIALVIQASAYAYGGEVFILDMGEPVSVDDLARRMIRLRGLRIGKDIAIEYTGIRPGEKLAEKLWCEVHERPARTPHPAITCVRNDNHFNTDALEAEIGQISTLLWQGCEEKLCARMYSLILAACDGCVGNPLLSVASHSPGMTATTRSGMFEGVVA